MKNMYKYVLSVSAATLALGAYAFAEHHEGVEAEVRAFYEQATASFLACDAEKIGAFSAEGHTGIYPDSLDAFDETSDEAVNEAKAFCVNGGKNELTYEITKVIPLSDAAVAIGKGHYKRTEPDGAVSIDTDYSFTEVLVKTDDGWKFRHSHVGVAIPMEDVEGAAAADDAMEE